MITYLKQDENDASRLRISAPRDLDISRVRFEGGQLVKTIRE